MREKARFDLVTDADLASQQTIQEFLRQRFPRTLSLSYGNDGPLMELVTLYEFGPRLKPKRVVWIYNWTELDDLVGDGVALVLDFLDRGGLGPRIGEVVHELVEQARGGDDVLGLLLASAWRVRPVVVPLN